MKSTVYTITAPLLAASLVQASLPGMTLGDNIRYVDDDDWDGLIARANATSTITVPFYDVSTNYSSRAQPSIGWEAKLSVVAGVPIPDSDDEFFTLSLVELFPPETLRLDNGTYQVAENQWRTCETWLFQVNDRKSEEIDPRCEGVLSDECLKDLQDLAETSDCGISFPDSCRGDSDEQLGVSGRKLTFPFRKRFSAVR